MGRWHVHQRDGNAKALREVLVARGATVEDIDQPVDWLIGYHGLTAVAEVKRPKGKLRTGQEKFFAEFRGLARVLRTEADAHELLNYLDDILRRCRKEIP